VAVSLVFWASEAWSCAVCVGNPTDPQSIGMSKAILGLLVITGGVLVSFASFFVVLWRRARRPVDSPADVLARLEQDFSQREEVVV
jgi:hypothetical protein